MNSPYIKFQFKCSLFRGTVFILKIKTLTPTPSALENFSAYGNQWICFLLS